MEQWRTLHSTDNENSLIYQNQTGQALISFSLVQSTGSLQRAKEILIEETLKNLMIKRNS